MNLEQETVFLQANIILFLNRVYFLTIP